MPFLFSNQSLGKISRSFGEAKVHLRVGLVVAIVCWVRLEPQDFSGPPLVGPAVLYSPCPSEKVGIGTL